MNLGALTIGVLPRFNTQINKTENSVDMHERFDAQNLKV